MAVKQNNTEANETPTSAGNDGNKSAAAAATTAGTVVGNVSKLSSVGAAGTVVSTGVILGGGVKAKSQKMSVSLENGAGNLSGVAESAGCSLGNILMDGCLTLNVCEIYGLGKGFMLSKNYGGSDMEYILHIIELMQVKRKSMSTSDLGRVYQHLILKLSRLQLPRKSAEELKRFKQDIAKVGEFFASANDQNHYLFYLRVVCQLVTQSDEEPPPSCAIAVIFQLFSADMVINAVQSLLETDIPQENIKRTVRLLCDWTRICNFCHNLNFWIIAILGGLQMQRKFELIDDIALENIELLFLSLIIPVLRPKLAPIVFRMLSTTRRPQVFHKVS